MVGPDGASADDPASFFQNRPGLWVSSAFQSGVLAKIANTSTETRHIDLERDMTDAEIEKKVGPGHIFGYEQVSRTIARMIAAQEGGKEGELLNNGFANILYTSSCVVRVHWSSGFGRWSVHLWQRVDDRWSAGPRVFCPATET
jgi:hypothetical protein